MTQIPPTLKPQNLPSMSDLLDTMKKEIMQSINCVKVGTIQSFNAATQEAIVQIVWQQVTSTKPDGTQTLAQFPLLLNVPVQFPSGGGFTLTFPVNSGDECIVLFNDAQIDNWLINGAIVPPSIDRVHDLSDAIAIVGIRNNTRALVALSTTSAQLRSDDGSTFVEVNGAGVKVHSGSVYEWDVQGYGQKITWTGGNNYTIDNYTTGSVITTNTHAISPPGPP